MGDLDNLRELFLNQNELDGVIPENLGNITTLTHLYLSDNNFVDEIPMSLGNLASLVELGLNGNLLRGNIPSTLGALSELDKLLLNGNDLSGCFPNSFRTNFCDIEYNFRNNSQLPWKGDFSRFCNNESQIYANCEIENSTNFYNLIGEDCQCTKGFPSNIGIIVGQAPNDKLIFENIDQFPSNRLVIFNRNGGILLDQQPYKVPWDGTFNEKELPVGTYYFTLDLGNGAQHRGCITLLK